MINTAILPSAGVANAAGGYVLPDHFVAYALIVMPGPEILTGSLTVIDLDDRSMQQCQLAGIISDLRGVMVPRLGNEP